MRYFKREENIKELVEVWQKSQVLDIVKNLQHKNKLRNVVSLYGDKEDTQGDIRVKNTGHELTDNYIRAIIKVILLA